MFELGSIVECFVGWRVGSIGFCSFRDGLGVGVRFVVLFFVGVSCFLLIV